MARYWAYLNNQVAGPFSVEQLIRTRGFSRQTVVCIDDNSGHPSAWISPADIPELAHIFKVVDHLHDLPASAPAPRPAPKTPFPKPVSRPAPVTAAPAPAAPRRSYGWLWAAIPLSLILAGAGGYFILQQQKQARKQDQELAQKLVEETRLPSSSLYASLRHFFEAKEIRPRWEFERQSTGLFNVNTSYYTGDGREPGRSVVYAFEANLEAQTVRGVNTAAIKLLSEGFPIPGRAAKPAPPKPAKTAAQKFPEALSRRVEAFEKGNFNDVWEMFSQHKRSQMIQAGISESGFVRLQSLTHGLESGIQQTVLKTKEDGPDHMLVLIRQSQPNHPDLFIKQQWVVEDQDWKFEDEDKKSAAEPAAPPASAETPNAAAKPNVLSLPGVSH